MTFKTWRTSAAHFVMIVGALGLAACASPTAPTTSDSATLTAELAREAPVATTQYGQVRGAVEDGVQVFKGVPYGADTRNRRFQRAVKPAAWTGVRDALAYPDTTPQSASGNTAAFRSWTPAPLPSQSEDMLGLNIWTPALDDEQRPVMVWLHGGGFVSGSGSSQVYDGVRLVNRGDVVLVTINHRLNSFGYLYLAGLDADKYADSGNVGNLDMIMALEWVRDNIANFGGDPENVTIFGESGGGRKVSTLLAMPEAEGLIDRAIVQSGSHLKVRTQEEATQDTLGYLERLGVTPDALHKLDELTMEELIAGLRVADLGGGRIGWGPVMDGTNITEHPIDGQPAAPMRIVPMLIGYNDDELALWLVNDRSIFAPDFGYDDIAPKIAPYFPAADREAVVEGYRKLYPDESPRELLYTIASDGRYGENAVVMTRAKAQWAAAHADAAPAWFYHFEWETPAFNGVLKTPHALELAFTFDNLAKSISIVGEDITTPQPLADLTSDAWIAFARNGDPNTPALPDWPAATPNAVNAMRLDLEPKLDADFFAGETDVLTPLPSRQ